MHINMNAVIARDSKCKRYMNGHGYDHLYADEADLDHREIVDTLICACSGMHSKCKRVRSNVCVRTHVKQKVKCN